MITFEEKLRESAGRLASQENKQLHVPRVPTVGKPRRLGWVATPAAAAVGIVLGTSLRLNTGNGTSPLIVQHIDTVRVERPIHDTIYLTQMVEKVRIVERPIVATQVAVEEDEDSSACTSVQCDGINYAALYLN